MSNVRANEDATDRKLRYQTNALWFFTVAGLWFAAALALPVWGGK